MRFFNQWGRFMTAGAGALARWEIDNAKAIMGNRKMLAVIGLMLIPIVLGGIAFADDIGPVLPDLLGGKKAYSPAFYSLGIFLVSIAIGMGAGLITGCIGAGGGFIIAPALMSAGIKGILAVVPTCSTSSPRRSWAVSFTASSATCRSRWQESF